MKKPSEEIRKVVEKKELEILRDCDLKDRHVKVEKFIRLLAEVKYMQNFIDEIYKTLNSKNEIQKKRQLEPLFLEETKYFI